MLPPPGWVRGGGRMTVAGTTGARAIALALAGLIASGQAGQATPAAFGSGLAGWSFTREMLQDGSVDCRATLQTDGRAPAMGFVATPDDSGVGYFTTDGPGLAGVWADSQMTAAGATDGLTVTGDGHRLMFNGIDAVRMEDIARAGGFTYLLPGVEGGSNRVDLGPRAEEALKMLWDCTDG